MAKAKMMVFAAAVEGQREEFDRWYEEQHIPDLLRVPGLVHAERYDVRVLGTPPGGQGWDSVSIYSLEGEDIMQIFGEMGRRMGTDEMPKSPALDSSRTFALFATQKGDAA